MNQLRTEILAGRECFIYVPPTKENEEVSYPVIYLHGDEATKLLVEEADYISGINSIIVGIMPKDRLSELTPWKADSLHEKFPNFGGEADAYISFIVNELKMEVDRMFPTMKKNSNTGLMGYSLGGLCTVYSMFLQDTFGVVASMSGSFWYPNFVSFVKDNEVKSYDTKVFLSSGDKEGVGHKDIKKDAVENTKEVFKLLSDKLGTSNISLTFDEGGHHNNRLERHKLALTWMDKELNSSK